MTALLTGLLLALAHPGFNFTFLAPVALVPLFYSACHSKRRVLWGFLSGYLYWFTACYWIQWTLERHGGMSVAESWALFLLFCAAKALQTALFSFAILPGRAPHPLFLAALWTALEWTHNYTGFAWLTLGNAALGWPWLAKLAPLTGVWGITFALALFSAILVTRQWPWLALYALLPFLPALPPFPSPDKTAWAVQPNLPEDAAWSPESVAALQRHLTQLSRSPTPPTLVVWPEVPAPLYDSDRFLPDVPRLTAAPLLAGIVSHNDRGVPLNSALLLSKDGRFVSRYDKVNLVPFGEFVPWPFDAIARKVSTEAGDFAPGALPVTAAGIGTFICYESVFPNYIRQFPLRGATALFNISNDSWFGHSAARDQHFLIARMRAAENRRWIVRVTNNGVTASIDPSGQVHEIQPSYQEIAAPLHYADERTLTPYTSWGDWFAYLCGVLALLGVVRSLALPNRL